MSQQKQRHCWTVEDRRLLCVLSRLYDNQMADVAAIMNILLAESLKSEGFTTAMTAATLQAQLHCMQRQGSPGSDVWLEIFSRRIPEVRTIYRALRDQIEDCALGLNISLHLKAKDVQFPKHLGLAIVRRGVPVKKIQGVLPSYVSSEDDTDGEIWHSRRQRRHSSGGRDYFSTPRRNHNHQLLTPTSGRSRGSSPKSSHKRRWSQLSGGLPTSLCHHADELGNKIRRHPRLVYRWYSRQSQGINTATEIRAGKFADRSITIPPPTWNVDAVRSHLTPEEVPSPFISFREALLPCFAYAMKADAVDNACIAIVDLAKVRATASAVSSPDFEDGMKPSAVLVNQFGLKLGRNGTYRGNGEWLIYGKVDAEAIVTTVKMNDILQYACQTPLVGKVLQLDMFRHSGTSFIMRELKRSAQSMSYQTGRAAGLLSAFMRIPRSPRELREVFAAKFATAWRLRGFNKAKPNKVYEEYMNGVYSVEGIWGLSQGSEDEAVDGMIDNEDEEDDAPEETMKRVQNIRRNLDTNDQDLIDNQLQHELSLSLGPSSIVSEVVGTMSNAQDKCSYDVDQGLRHTSSLKDLRHSSHNSSLAKPRDSSMFSFSRPPLPGWKAGTAKPNSRDVPPIPTKKSTIDTFPRPAIPGKPTDWEATTTFNHSRAISPTAAEPSALDTFTAELLAKAEECSTLGSFGRGPSTPRGSSVVSLPFRATPLEPVVESAGRNQGTEGASVVREIALREEAVVISDDESEGSVEELDFVILKERKIGG